MVESSSVQKKCVDVILREMFSGEQGSPKLMAELNDLRGFSNLNDPVVLGKKQLLLLHLA